MAMTLREAAAALKINRKSLEGAINKRGGKFRGMLFRKVEVSR